MRVMASDTSRKSLHPLEVKTLLHYDSAAVFGAAEMQASLSLVLGQCNQALSWLSAKGLIEESRRSSSVVYERTALGERFFALGTPAQRIIGAVVEYGALSMAELAEKTGLEKRDVGSSFGSLSKKLSVLAMDDEKRVVLAPGVDREAPPDPDAALHALLGRAAEEVLVESALTDEQRAVVSANAKKRGAASAMFRVVEREEVWYHVTAAGARMREELVAAGVTGEEVGRLTPEMLRDGSWREVSFREYAVNAPAGRLLPGRRNAYVEYLDSVKDKLVSLGFQQFDGPLVETEFWNSDALFMPQFHAARDIHDVYYVKEPTHAREIAEPYLSRVATTHENGWESGSRGWNYAFDRDFTRRLILRSQGTVMSAKTLHTASVPGKYFGVLRCFRYDQVDATHLSDFYQTEGIVLGEDVNLRSLLGMLKMFATELAGATDVRYVPGYFPFTEPSVEVHIKHPQLGWFELGGAGIFRPEVTSPMGVDVPVLAWGLGVDRMALMHLGLSDLRDLFSPDIESVRLRRRA